MKAPKPLLVGDMIRAGLITRDDVLALVGQIFDGKRVLPVGSGECKVRLRKHAGLTRHLQECVTTILLTSEGIPPAGTAVEAIPEAEAAADAEIAA